TLRSVEREAKRLETAERDARRIKAREEEALRRAQEAAAAAQRPDQTAGIRVAPLDRAPDLPPTLAIQTPATHPAKPRHAPAAGDRPTRPAAPLVITPPSVR